jgi:hypothetical protein
MWRAIPSRTARSAPSGWSYAQGMTKEGRPARIASPVVPTSPWWTMAAARGRGLGNLVKQVRPESLTYDGKRQLTA